MLIGRDLFTDADVGGDRHIDITLVVKAVRIVVGGDVKAAENFETGSLSDRFTNDFRLAMVATPKRHARKAHPADKPRYLPDIRTT